MLELYYIVFPNTFTMIRTTISQLYVREKTSEYREPEIDENILGTRRTKRKNPCKVTQVYRPWELSREKYTRRILCQQKRQQRENIRYTNDTFDLLSAWLETTATERLQNTHYRNILSGVVVYNCHRHDAWRWQNTPQMLCGRGLVSTLFTDSVELTKCRPEKETSCELGAQF